MGPAAGFEKKKIFLLAPFEPRIGILITWLYKTLIPVLKRSSGASHVHSCVASPESVQQLPAPVSVRIPDSAHGV